MWSFERDDDRDGSDDLTLCGRCRRVIGERLDGHAGRLGEVVEGRRQGTSFGSLRHRRREGCQVLGVVLDERRVQLVQVEPEVQRLELGPQGLRLKVDRS